MAATPSRERVLITASTRIDSQCGRNIAGRTIVDARYDLVGSELRLSEFRISPTIDETWSYAAVRELPPQRTS